YHAFALGEAFQEVSHDADLYLSLTGKSQLRDEYELSRNPRLNKDSVTIDGEDIDVYVEHQHHLGVPYDTLVAYAQVTNGVRVASLEHLLVLKLDAAANRQGTQKGEKDVRDLVKVVALLDRPRQELLKPLQSVERSTMLHKVIARKDIGRILGLNDFETKRFVTQMQKHARTIDVAWNGK
ncbi:MAG TPA: hypothetical protein VMS32_11475, partial [Verrucomicrobiae bacterium]|nr:hypothetical protein [Verrucomicrobiae bacterium]